MPALKIITPVLGGRYYHIFNRGNNGQVIFFNEENYKYFLQLFNQFMLPYVELLAYCLLSNHFHFLIKTKDSIEFSSGDSIPQKEKDGIPCSDEGTIGKIVSNQFRRLFITYSMAINHQEKRTGSLFSKNFKRLEIEDEEYLKYVAFYIHYNPEKHEYVEDFRKYRFSSWMAYNSIKTTRLNKELLMEFFGGYNEMLEYHKYLHDENKQDNLE